MSKNLNAKLPRDCLAGSQGASEGFPRGQSLRTGFHHCRASRAYRPYSATSGGACGKRADSAESEGRSGQLYEVARHSNLSAFSDPL